MSWQAASLVILALVLIGGFVWFERSRPPARVVAAVAAMAALGVAGRLAFAPVPNVVATTDVAMLAGYSLGAGPGFAVGALSGLVSNFWLGQGPWTPWQMAGWGLVGIGGAALARFTARRMGRLGLASVAALMGFAYGALLDYSVMVEFGGEQSLDRYLALSARGLPFNIAHAAGNFVLMFAAGPALIRMLDRYRGRFDHRWSDVPLGRAAVSLVVLTCLVSPLLMRTDDASAAGREAARTWLEGVQNDDGGFGTGPDIDSSADMTGWAMAGLEAAGINPRDVVSGGFTPIEYLRKNVDDINSVGDIELVILGLEGAGLDSRSFQGRDLVDELRDKQADDGSFQHQVNLTAYAILAQRAAGESGNSIGRAASWLRSIQNKNGGWASVPKGESEPDSTGSVMQALAVSPGKRGMIDDAAKWLERTQHKDGGWSLTEGAASNSQSTAWAIQGLVAADISPGTIKNDGTSGADFLFSRQASDGRFAYSGTSDQTPVWVTAQALMGVAQQTFPIPPVERVKPDPPDPAENNADGTTPGYTPPTYTPPNYDIGSNGYDPGDYDFGGSNGGSDSGGGNDNSGGSGPGTAPGDDLSLPGLGSESEIPGAGTETDPLETFAQSSATPLPQLPSQSSPLPDTFVFLAGIGLLAAGLGAGFIRFRRRQL